MFRLWMLALAVFAASAQPPDSLPLDDWLPSSNTPIRWSLRVRHPTLSMQQRLEAVIVAEVDASEFIQRPARGQMFALFQIRDRARRVYPSRRPLLLPKATNPADLLVVRFELHAFVLPGDYAIAAAIYDTHSNQHNLKRATLHVARPARDPLPGLWRDLPPVEFAAGRDLAGNSARLSLALESPKPVRVDVILNQSLAPRVLERTALPALHVISRLKISNGSLGFSVLDLDRRKVIFAGENSLDSARLDAALAQSNPHVIEASALRNYRDDAQFFLSEIRKRLDSAGDSRRALIVLSAPMVFPKGENLHPIEASPQPGTRVFYLRFYKPGVPRIVFPDSPPEVYARGRVVVTPNEQSRKPALIPPLGRHEADLLEQTLKPLGVTLFDIDAPADFRRALSAILKQLAQPD